MTLHFCSCGRSFVANDKTRFHCPCGFLFDVKHEKALAEKEYFDRGRLQPVKLDKEVNVISFLNNPSNT